MFQRGTDFFRKYWSLFPETDIWSGGTVSGGTNYYVTGPM